MNKTILAGVILSLAALPASAAQVSRSAKLAAPVAKVWQMIKPFCSVSDWHPAVEKCELRRQDGAEERSIAVKGGGMIDERLLGASDAKHSVRYTILTSPLPVKDYVSTITLKADGKGTRIVWGSHFTANGVSDAEAEKIVAGIYTSGFDGLKKALAAK